MKLKDAIMLGKSCGLASIPEAINNVLAHDLSLFEYEIMVSEERELRDEALKKGIQFCAKCGMALLNDECYMCRNFQSIFLGKK